ncbi:hypothetical protein FA10DRAFT_153469 [Acaromyces ingoldii]|uniref:Uncharacterized protein n=1 Tax=Acaromyces ingoldii TaxID=215250 RepID=A0A316YIZ4_9BASI|nr:hypothetical protein FA10DRAFT_153469 [Acaromyces ingoldii]PWN88063.1 hypothetical protein FA10DRAFT_153469 [Acaromyces ingoldii]
MRFRLQKPPIACEGNACWRKARFCPVQGQSVSLQLSQTRARSNQHHHSRFPSLSPIFALPLFFFLFFFLSCPVLAYGCPLQCSTHTAKRSASLRNWERSEIQKGAQRTKKGNRAGISSVSCESVKKGKKKGNQGSVPLRQPYYYKYYYNYYYCSTWPPAIPAPPRLRHNRELVCTWRGGPPHFDREDPCCAKKEGGRVHLGLRLRTRYGCCCCRPLPRRALHARGRQTSTTRARTRTLKHISSQTWQRGQHSSTAERCDCSCRTDKSFCRRQESIPRVRWPHRATKGLRLRTTLSFCSPSQTRSLKVDQEAEATLRW